MNRTDAAAVLGIDAAASPDEAKRAYQELFTEHQVRLTNAPTPALRSLYQTRLLELDEARDAFLADSLSDADSDLPTDQPSIPTYSTTEPAQRRPPPPPPPSSTQPPPRNDRKVEEPVKPKEPATPHRTPETVSEPAAAPPRKSAAPKGLGVALGLVVAAGSLWFGLRALQRDSGATSQTDTAAVAPRAAFPPDSVSKFRESITVARVEFGRGDYDAANGALKEGDDFYSRIDSDARTDTAVVQIKSQLDSLHTKVQRACDALKKVAARHPGEPTCKTI